MLDRDHSSSTQMVARVAGLIYLIIPAAALFAEMFVRSTLIVPDDAAATAANILREEHIYRLGGAAQLVTVLCDVALSGLFYVLLRPVGRTVALISSSFRFAAIIVLAVATITHFAPLSLLKGEMYAEALGTAQVQALAALSLRLHSVGYTISLLLFGVHLALLGYLVARSRFLPWIFGMLLTIAGVGYVANSFAFFVAPPLTSWIFPVLVPVAFVAEAGFALWLLVRGVNLEKWRHAAAGARD